ncbi:MAG TPA: PD-(D/E)XK nuclease family protein [Acidimicrobiales bacterium]|nr:PD-(D/E)XK nuclease family protein [Acidimicrobiales bacterium]
MCDNEPRIRHAGAMVDVAAGVAPALLTPTQQRVSDELLDRGGARPIFPDNLGEILRAELEEQLAPVAARVPEGEPVWVSKGTLSQVLHCETHHVTEAEAGFEWTPANAKGTVAHKAIEITVGMGRTAPAGELVDLAITRLVETGADRGPGRWIEQAAEVEVAELRTNATDIVAKFQDAFPPLSRKWTPRVEWPLKARLCDERIHLQGKPDLVLGQAIGTQARVLIVDFKTGRPSNTHIEDLRFYAVLETLRCGVPPFRLATYYLDSGTWHAEDVTVDALRSAALRIAGGVSRLVELQVDRRPPTLTPGPTCMWCRLRTDCPGAARWAEERDANGLPA